MTIYPFSDFYMITSLLYVYFGQEIFTHPLFIMTKMVSKSEAFFIRSDTTHLKAQALLWWVTPTCPITIKILWSNYRMT